MDLLFIALRAIFIGDIMPKGVYIRTESIRKALTKHEFCSIEGCNNRHHAKGLCKKHYYKKYRQDNKEHRAKYDKKWQKDNKGKFLKYVRQWSQDNKKHIAEWRKQYEQTPVGKASRKAINHNRRILTKGLTLAIVQRVYEDNIKKYGTLTCILCNKPIMNNDDSLEHLTPLSRGGGNNYENLGIAHQSCNSQKFTKTLEEWFSHQKNKLS